MAELILAPEAEAELDDIWLYIARESGSIEIANRVVDSITGRFWLLARYPYSGRQRDHDLGAGLRSLASGDYIVIHRLESDQVVLILHIVLGSRDIGALLTRLRT